MKIIKFYSDSCSPCKVIDTNLKKAGIEYISINVNDDNNYPIVEKYKIKSIPTIVKEKDNIEIDRYTGIMTVEQLKNWCKN